VLGASTAPVPQATAEGEPTGDETTATIGPEGGTLASSDGRCKVTVPPDALTAPTALTLRPIANLAWGGVGTAYRLGPAGTTFDVPVTVAFDVAGDASAPVSLGALGIAEQDGDGYWSWIRNVERTEESAPAAASAAPSQGGEAADEKPAGPKRSVSGSTRKTGGKAVVGSARLDPAWKLVEPGEKVPLQISACYPDESEGPLASLTGGPCTPVGSIATDNWSVGPAGAYRGEVSGARARGTYTAPFTRPNPAMALVSVHVASWQGLPGVVLQSRFSINPPDLTGTFNITEKWKPAPGLSVTLKFEGHADLRFVNEHEGPPPYESLPYTMDGWLTLKTQSYTWNGLTCSNTGAATMTFAGNSASYFNVWHRADGTNKVHWVLEPQHWAFTCTPGGQTQYVAVSFGLLSGSQGCTTPEWVAFPDENHPAGTFSETCNVGVTYDADWKFDPQ
jgi:hypothetical protein